MNPYFESQEFKNEVIKNYLNPMIKKMKKVNLESKNVTSYRFSKLTMCYWFTAIEKSAAVDVLIKLFDEKGYKVEVICNPLLIANKTIDLIIKPK